MAALSLPAHAAPVAGAQRRITLTAEESNWLAANPEIKIALDSGNPPICFEGADGKFGGASVDYTNLIAQIAGLQVRYVGAPWNETLRRAMHHEVDAVMSARYREERRSKLDFTNPYLQIPIGMATRKAWPSVRKLADFGKARVAIIKGTVRIPLMKKNCPSCSVIEVDTPLAGVKLVADGSADAFFDDLPVVQNAIEIGLLTDFKIALYFYSDAGSLRFGVRNTAPALLSILDKAIAGQVAAPVGQRGSAARAAAQRGRTGMAARTPGDTGGGRRRPHADRGPRPQRAAARHRHRLPATGRGNARRAL
jgi:ABC-type amino acid transport substrate-binding protein